ncbi:hypothetical protein BV210_08520 [Halorientalis sp. IM1011]|uniref:hypothetical protein n=1 Tax=Halorientalis sp. IM1011 TaxID=1932360 RepID=UPI00097CCBC1|nr:hypothetical protein [Halorientalis sp. IM1011]AQL42750.1 hypothetical protein BV210_08520 [Halorientalis sp. IM1011]
MYRTVQYAGYFALVVTPLALLAGAFVAPPVLTTGRLTLGGGVALVGGLAAVTERERALSPPTAAGFDRSDARDALAVVAGAVLAYLLSVHAGLGPVVGSAAVGLAAGLAPTESDVAAYCGSFVGMASPAVFPGVGPVAVAGVISGLAFVAARDAFGGVGGKLGTLALFGCGTTVALTGFDYAGGTALPWAMAPEIVAVAVVGAVVTVVLSVRLGLGGVIGSAAVGLVAGIALPALVAGGTTLATVAFCASFVGMSSTDRLADERLVAVAGVICGLVFVFVSPAFVGSGGKLGTIAFVSCVTTIGLTELAALR